MKTTLRENITDLPYCLHDMHVTAFYAADDELIFEFADGFEKSTGDCARVSGRIRFFGIDWDFCHAYVLNFSDNAGKFVGRKQSLCEFVSANRRIDFEIVDETYGYNSSKFSGYIREGKKLKECFLELYHIGGMEYITEE